MNIERQVARVCSREAARVAGITTEEHESLLANVVTLRQRHA
jgi:hypothetical protein